MLYNPCDICQFRKCKSCRLYAIQGSEIVLQKTLKRSISVSGKQAETIQNLYQELEALRRAKSDWKSKEESFKKQIESIQKVSENQVEKIKKLERIQSEFQFFKENSGNETIQLGKQAKVIRMLQQELVQAREVIEELRKSKIHKELDKKDRESS